MPGDKRWVINELARLDRLGLRQIDLLDLAVLSPKAVETRLREADVVYASGGDVCHLARSVLARDLVALFDELLAEKVYVGVSAGSMIFSRHLNPYTAAMFAEDDDPTGVAPPFGYFDWFLVPHWRSDFAPERDDEWAERIEREVDFPLYFIDDETAVQVRSDGASHADPVVDVISEGRWRLLGSWRCRPHRCLAVA